MRGRCAATRCCCAARGCRNERLPRCRSGTRSVTRHDASIWIPRGTNAKPSPSDAPVSAACGCVGAPLVSRLSAARGWTRQASLPVRLWQAADPPARESCTSMERARSATPATTCLAGMAHAAPPPPEAPVPLSQA